MGGLERTKLCVRVGGLFVDGVFDGLVVGLHGDFVLAGAAFVVVVLDFAGRDVLGAHGRGGWTWFGVVCLDVALGIEQD